MARSRNSRRRRPASPAPAPPTREAASPAAAAPLPAAAALLPAALLLSGFASLVYQVVWVRRFAVTIGTANAAVTLVLALFLGGLGLGAALAGRSGGRLGAARLARRFALLEIGAAAFALLLPLYLDAALPLLRALYSPGAAPLVAGLVAAVFLLPAATLMGATLPTLTALDRRTRRRAESRTAAWLYAANTLGALVGSVAAARWLVPDWGLAASTGFAAAANLVAAGSVFGWSRSRWFGRVGPVGAAPESAAPAAAGSPKTGGGGGARPRRAAAVAALSGSAAMAAEVAWARLAALLFGPTIYTFACVVAGVILGAALGSAFAGRLLARRRGAGGGPRRTAAKALAFTQLGAAAAGAAIVALADDLVLPIGRQIARRAGEVASLLDLQFLQTVAALLVPGALLGAAFPLAVALAAAGSEAGNEGEAGRATGRIYGWTAAGNAGGALAAGLVVIPLLGIEAALVAAVLAHAVAAAVALPRPGVLGAALAATLLAGTAARSWDWDLLSGGLYQAAAQVEPHRHRDFLRRGRTVFLGQDAAATVSAKRVAGETSLAIDGKVDATDGADMLTQRLLAHLPLALADGGGSGFPKSVFIVGYGSGVTAGAALRHPVERVAAAEISPEVAEAARLFAASNGSPREDERFELLPVDARNHLLLGEDRYEVVISEPSNPWMSGVSPLFTVEFFESVRSRLAPGGLFCQWIHLYRLAEPELQTVVAGFTEVFPESAAFTLHDGDALLLGANGPFPEVPPEEVRRRLARVADETAPYGLTGPEALASFYAASGEELARWAAEAPRHRDDRPILEFRAPLSAHRETAADNRRTLRRLGAGPGRFAADEPPDADALTARAEGLLSAASPVWALEVAERALELDLAHPAAALALVRAAAASGETETGERVLRRLLGAASSDGAAGPDRPAAERLTTALARLLHAAGRLDEAAAALESGPPALARDPEALLLAAEVQVGRNELDSAAALVGAALREEPRNPDAAAWLAELRLRAGDSAQAAEDAAAVLREHPAHPRALRARAVALAGAADGPESREAAREAFAELVRRAPDPAIHWANFGAFERESGRFAAAVAHYREAVDRDPANRIAYEGLLESALAAGDREQARRAREVLAAR